MKEDNYALIIADPDTNGKYQSLDHSYSEAESIMQLRSKWLYHNEINP